MIDLRRQARFGMIDFVGSVGGVGPDDNILPLQAEDGTDVACPKSARRAALRAKIHLQKFASTQYLFALPGRIRGYPSTCSPPTG